MKCPKCGNDETRVVWSRDRPEAGMRRRRECPTEFGGCGLRFSTCEVVVAEDAVRPIGELYDAEERRLAANREKQDAGQRR